MNFSEIVNNVISKLGKTEIDSKIAGICIPVPAFSTRVLLQNEGFFLGKVIHIVGEESSFKSTFSLEIARWHLLSEGGAVIFETESRPVVDVQRAALSDENRYACISCSSLDEWQSGILYIIKEYQADSGKKPLCMIVDSVLGCNTQDTIRKQESEGASGPRYATESRTIADYLRSHTNKLFSSLMTLVLVNHRKMRPSGNFWSPQPVKSSLGGSEIRFYSSYEFELSRQGDPKNSLNSLYQHEVTFKVLKNTFGIQDFILRCPVRFVKQGATLVSVEFDWYTASINILTSDRFFNPPLSQANKKLIKEVCDIQAKSAGPRGTYFWCPQLGVSKENAVPPKELGRILEEHKDILDVLYDVFGIRRRYLYNPSLTFEENLNNSYLFEKNYNNVEEVKANVIAEEENE